MGEPHNVAIIPGYGFMDNKYLRLIEQQMSRLISEECWLEVSGRGRAKMMHFAHGARVELAVHTNVDHNRIAYCSMLQMPGCCGVCISTGNFVEPKYRKKGLNNIFNRFRIDLARHLGYTALMCTDITSNAAQRKTLAKNGWRDVYTFTNRRTKNEVNISVVDVFNVPPVKHPRSWVQEKKNVAAAPIVRTQVGQIMGFLNAIPLAVPPMANIQQGIQPHHRFMFCLNLVSAPIAFAADINELYYAIKEVHQDALRFHAPRHDFSTWVRAILHNVEVANRLRQVEVHNYQDVEALRNALLNAIDGPPNDVDESS